MKKLFYSIAITIALFSCNNSSSSDGSDNHDTTDAAGLTNPSAIDTVKHGDGIINSNVISTDTAAMNMQNSINKANEAKKNK